MTRILCPTLCLLAILAGPVQRGAAQTPSAAEELLTFVPADSGFCLVVQNLRGQAEKWQRTPWVKTLRASALGQAFVSAPEVKQLLRLEEELKKRLEVDWPTLRDEILGDAVVFAYRPAVPGNPDHEQGLLLLRARRADMLAQFVERLNQEQKKAGELKDLATLEHKGIKYQRRTDRRATHYLLVHGNLLAFTSKEQLVRSVIDQSQAAFAASAIAQQIQRAGANQALAALWINPRAFEAELEFRAQKDSSPDALTLRTFLAYWRPMEAVVLSLSAEQDFDCKLALQARTRDLPAAVRKIFQGPTAASELWNRFPADALLTVADRLDLSSISESLADFATPENRKSVLDALQKSVGAALGLNLTTEVLPNVGPDWGLCLWAAPKPGQFPNMLAAVAVRPGSGQVPVDQALLKGVQFFAGLAVFDHNRRNPNPLRIQSEMQDKVDVKFLAGDKVLPPGLQPAWCLKDGYLVFATSPQAILAFASHAPRTPDPAGAPVLQLSTFELARFLRQHREEVALHLAEKNHIPKAVANQGLEKALDVLDLVERVTLLQNSGDGQLTWTLRVRPRQ